jgi:SAM-dependent methyltransferase
VAIQKIVEDRKPSNILEVGCGTGHWLEILASSVPERYGLDSSFGMLSQANQRTNPAHLVQGYAQNLPYTDDRFDMILVVNALHHFNAPVEFISEAYRLLRLEGILVIIGGDHLDSRDDWYIYKYFEGTYETDLARFPSWDTIEHWMMNAGFKGLTGDIVEQVVDHKYGRDVLQDPFLEKHMCSQLALLSDQDYEQGLRRIEASLTQAEASGEILVFPAEFTFRMLRGEKVK